MMNRMLRCRIPAKMALTVAVLGVTSSAVAAKPAGGVQVGDTSFGLPGVERVPLVGVERPRLALAVDAGYAFTESQLSEGIHHRIQGRFGLGMTPLEWLELGARVLGRHDRHPDDGMGTDTGTTTDFALVARAGHEVGSGFALGCDLGATFPGAEHVGDSFSSPALDARLLSGWARGDGIRIAGYAGYRLDMTEGVAKDRDRYRLGDRLALGASGYDAVLVGIGTSVPLDGVELLAEVSGDILIGRGAPGLAESPLRASLGVRAALSDVAALQLLGTASLSSRPDLEPASPLVPIEPRLGALLGFRYRFWQGPEVPLARDSPETRRGAPPPESPRKVAPPPEPPKKAEPPPTNTVRITVVDKNTNHPLSDAEAEIILDGEVRSLKFVTGSTFELSDVPIGRAELVVRADRLEEWREPVEVTAGEPVEIQVAMTPVANSGQIRGLIRGFDGKGLKAQVRIEPGGHQVESTGDGAFRVDVPPGKYDVEVSLDGYRTQKLKAQVGKDGVVVLNVDMMKGTQ